MLKAVPIFYELSQNTKKDVKISIIAVLQNIYNL